MSRDPLRALAPPRAGRPAYRQIEESLLELIDAGRLAAGDRMPPERDLAARLGVSRMTLRQALDGLVRRGLLVRRGGRGTFVAAPKVEQDLRVLRSYPEELHDQGVATDTRILRFETVPASLRVAAALGVDAGASLHQIERLRRAGGEPLLLESAWVEVERVPDLAREAVARSLWGALAEAGHPVVRAVERLEPVVAGQQEARLLRVAAGSPLMLVQRTAYTTGGRAVEHAVGVFRGDRASFVVEVSGVPGAVDR
jgi:GntR family transcriptional regulator